MFYRATNRGVGAGDRHRHVQRDADQERHLFRQAAMLLLYRAASWCRARAATWACMFFVDPDLVKDPRPATCDTITLSYTMFRKPDATASRAQPRPARDRDPASTQLSETDRSGRIEHDRYARDNASSRSRRRARAWPCDSHGHGPPKHPYHLVDPSPWPIASAVAAGLLAFGGILYMHGGHRWLLIIGFIAVLSCMAVWWRDVIREATFQGYAHAGRAARAALRHGAVHRLRGDVLLGLFLGLLLVEPVPGRRRLAAQGHPPVRPVRACRFSTR